MQNTAINNKFYIGVDGGGSKTHAVLVNKDMELIDEEYGGPANIATDLEGAYNSIRDVIDKLVARHKLDQAGIKIGIGVAGYSAVDKRNSLFIRLHEKYPGVVLNSDCHIGCLAAHEGNDGAVVICGTGVVAYSIQNGQARQLGGWGFPHGDLGGGAYLGLEIARLLCKAIDEIIPWNRVLHSLYIEFFQEDSYKYKMWLIGAKPVDYAQIARFIFSRPIDELAAELLDRGAHEISQLIFALQNTNTNLAIKLAGGLSKLYLNKLQEKHPALALSEAMPAYGAVRLLFKSYSTNFS